MLLFVWRYKLKIHNPFRDLSRFELILWLSSVLVTVASFFLSGCKDPVTAIASLIGVTALIFVAKGYVLGQVLSVVFALFYGFISFFLSYYGEMITYLCMTAPIAAATVIEWIRHPYKGTREVEVRHLTNKRKAVLIVGAVVVTVIFYFILRALGNASLIPSTISVTTSFLASYLTYCRSPYYALAYAANDIVLIILWVIAAIGDISYLPMIFCFVMFFVNDMYGFFNWKRMQKRQTE